MTDTDQTRYQRAVNRRVLRVLGTNNSKEVNEQQILIENVTETVEHEDILVATYKEISTQTDAYVEDFYSETVVFMVSQHYGNETATQTVIHAQTNTTTEKPSTRSTQCGPDNHSCYFSGYSSLINSKDDSVALDLCGVTLPVLGLLISFFTLSGVRNCRKQELGMEDKLVLFLMKLKLGITFAALGSLFSIHPTTASRIFYKMLNFLTCKTAGWIKWLSKNVIKKTMPTIFKEFYPSCRVIIDCFEVKTNVPQSHFVQNCLYSQYKSAHTAKYLVGISPGGCITYISNGYGGRSTDAAITLDCGILNLLEAGDMVMADRGFPQIKIACEESNVILVMPPMSTKGQQFSEQQMELTQKIASVRIHVERAIQRIRTYNILQTRVPVELLHVMDDIVYFCCILTNLQPPIIKDCN